MADSIAAEELGGLDQVFRPTRRRKQYRRRNDEDDEHASTNPNTSTPQPEERGPPQASLLEGQAFSSLPEDVPMSELFMQRKALQRRKGGIEFSNKFEPSKTQMTVMESTGRPTEQDEISNEIEKVVNRFAPQTGQIADVNKHMMAYIDSELVKRRYGQDPSQLSNGQTRETSPGGTITEFGRNRPAAGLGRLHEVDLGEDARLRNISLTEAAKRRLEGGEQLEEVTGKVRLGRDGKPRRARKRRRSADIKRDKLVEEVLKESKLEIYDDPEDIVGEGEEAADERIAEQFRRDFLDAMSNRRRRRPAAAKKTGPGAKKEEEKSKGPKLGGSRSARAAMRELEKAKEAKK